MSFVESNSQTHESVLIVVNDHVSYTYKTINKIFTLYVSSSNGLEIDLNWVKTLILRFYTRIDFNWNSITTAQNNIWIYECGVKCIIIN